MPIEPSSPWIAVADQEPPFATCVLVTDGSIVALGAYHYGLLGHPRTWAADLRSTPTHWMPIPDLPKPTEAA